VKLEVVGTAEWFLAVTAGIVPTTPEAEDFLRALEDELSPRLRLSLTAGGEKKHIGVASVVEAYKKVGGNVSYAAKELGVARSTVRDRLKKAGKQCL
jgi:transcriptional regulator of acetoin/glycerol metabolism